MQNQSVSNCRAQPGGRINPARWGPDPQILRFCAAHAILHSPGDDAPRLIRSHGGNGDAADGSRGGRAKIGDAAREATVAPATAVWSPKYYTRLSPRDRHGNDLIHAIRWFVLDQDV